MPWFRRRPTPEWYGAFLRDLEAFSRTLSPQARPVFERCGDDASLSFQAPTTAHRTLALEASPAEFDYQLGKVWTEQIDPTPAAAAQLLAMCDAVRDGRVREVRDRESRLIYHLYRLKTRGLDQYFRDGEYAFRHRFRLPIRNIDIRRLPPLTQSETRA